MDPFWGALLAPRMLLKRYWDAIGQRLGRSEASGVDFGPSGVVWGASGVDFGASGVDFRASGGGFWSLRG